MAIAEISYKSKPVSYFNHEGVKRRKVKQPAIGASRLSKGGISFSAVMGIYVSKGDFEIEFIRRFKLAHAVVGKDGKTAGCANVNARDLLAQGQFLIPFAQKEAFSDLFNQQRAEIIGEMKSK